MNYRMNKLLELLLCCSYGNDDVVVVVETQDNLLYDFELRTPPLEEEEDHRYEEILLMSAFPRTVYHKQDV